MVTGRDSIRVMTASPTDDQATISALLRPGERLLWSGRPDPPRHVTGKDAALIPFSILWCGFAIFWEASVLRTGAPLAMALFGIPFVLIGLYFVVGRFVVKARSKKRTRYAVTDRRALIVRDGGSVRDTPVAGQPLSVNRSANGRHASVTIGRTSTGFPFGGLAIWENTGMDLFAGSASFSLVDVAEPDAMLGALEHSASAAPRP